MDDLKMQKRTLKKAYKKAKRKTITLWKVLTILCAIVMVVSVPLSVLAAKFDNTLAAFYGGTFWELENEDTNAQYFTSDFNSAEEMVNYGLALTQQVEAEGRCPADEQQQCAASGCRRKGQHLLQQQRQPRVRRHRFRQH